MRDDFLTFPDDEEPAPEEGLRAYVPAGALSEVPPGKVVSIWLKNRKVAVFNVKGRLLACKDRCTHMGAPLSEGRLVGDAIVCGWHGWTFDLDTGRCLNKDWASVESYRVRIVGDRYEIELPVD